MIPASTFSFGVSCLLMPNMNISGRARADGSADIRLTLQVPLGADER